MTARYVHLTCPSPCERSMDYMVQKLTDEQQRMLFAPLPREALKPHPTKSFLTVITPIYVLERLNNVFGIGNWEFRTEPVDVGSPTSGSKGRMCVVKGILDIPLYGIHLEQYGGNDNPDMGDAYKGAATDALTKIASYLGIGFEVYKGKRDIGSPRDLAEEEYHQTVIR
jgi:hypothetical protein